MVYSIQGCAAPQALDFVTLSGTAVKALTGMEITASRVSYYAEF
jgi:hypothetical protein